MQLPTLITPLALLAAVVSAQTSVGTDGLTTSWTTVTTTQTTTLTSTVLSNATAHMNNTLPSSTGTGPARYSPTLPVSTQTLSPTPSAGTSDASSNLHAGAAVVVGFMGAAAALFL